MRENGLRAVGGLAQRLTAGIARGRGASIARLQAEWPAIVGPDLARVTRPEALISGRGARSGRPAGPASASGGTPGKLLRLRVASAAALEVQHSSRLIVERVNACFGHRQIDDIRLVQGTIPQPPVPRRPPPTDPAVAAHMEGRVGAVEDPELRAALARLGARIAVTRRGAIVGTLGALLFGRDLKAQVRDPLKLLGVVTGDHILGKPDAPNILIDYFSMTCPHCANFNAAVLPDLKREWIDTGRLQFIMRHFPSDAVATHAAQLAESRGPGKFYETTDALLRTQVDWLTAADPDGEMVRVLATLGMAPEEARAVLEEGREMDKIIADVQSGHVLGVKFTPTLFINENNYGNPTGGLAGIAAILGQVGR